MRAAVFAGPQKIEIVERPFEELEAGHVRVKLEGCGICASNLPVWQGRPWFRYPMEPGSPGHEGWGVVAETAGDVDAFQAGDRVAFIGSRSYAEYETVPAGSLVRIPAHMDGPMPGEPFACAMNVFQRSGIRKGQRVAVVGIGFLGAMLVQLASRAGAEVIAISRRSYALSVAAKCGARNLVRMDEPYLVVEAVNRITNSAGCDVVIEAVGAQQPLDLAGKLTGVRGRLVVAGYHQDGLRQINMQEWNWKGIDVINAHERDSRLYIEGIERAIRAIDEGVLCPDELLTSEYTLEELPDAFEDMQNRPSGFLKGCLKFD